MKTQDGRATVSISLRAKMTSQTLGSDAVPVFGDANIPTRWGVLMATSYAPRSGLQAVPLSIPMTVLWLAGSTVLALLAYYFISMDEGAAPILGSDMHVREFVHDACHFLGFLCH